MKLKFPKRITIASYTFNIKQNKLEGGASFSFTDREIIIGTINLERDVVSTFNLICHELFEVCSVITNVRYDDNSVSNNYKFFMDHKEFEVTTELFSKAVSEFIA